jgi:hypothetical protein
MFLKQRFGVGYHMTLAKADVCDVEGVRRLIQQFVPGAAVSESQCERV